MLLSIEFQRVRHDLVTIKQQNSPESREQHMQKLLNCLLGKEFPDGLVVRNHPAILEMWV